MPCKTLWWCSVALMWHFFGNSLLINQQVFQIQIILALVVWTMLENSQHFFVAFNIITIFVKNKITLQQSCFHSIKDNVYTWDTLAQLSFLNRQITWTCTQKQKLKIRAPRLKNQPGPCWSVRQSPSKDLIVSPTVAIPQKSKTFWSILDLPFIF